jgi:glycosyltransferase involved in cell wall biosynthesis
LEREEDGSLGVAGDRRRKTVWCISKYAVPLKYGYGHRLFTLAREFRALGCDALVISSDSNHLAQIPTLASTYTRENVDGVDAWWIRTLKYRRSGSIRRVLSWLDFEMKLWLMPKRALPRPDVVIVSSLSLLTVLNGARLKRQYGCKLIFEVRDIWPLTMVAEAGYSRWHPLVVLLGWVEKFGCRAADTIVGTMPNLTEHVARVTKRKLDCHCIPLGYDPDLYSHQESLPEGYEAQYIPRGKFIVGYAGSLGVSNAMDTLVDCAIEMQESDKVHFLVVGDGALLKKYKEETRDLRNITFAPKVRKSQVPAILARCDVLYFSARESEVWRYGQSLNKVIEYMMAGKPIIASYSGYPSMIDEAGCGVFVPANDVPALKRAIGEYAERSPEELEAMGRRGRAWVIEHRSYRRLAEEYAKLF